MRCNRFLDTSGRPGINEILKGNIFVGPTQASSFPVLEIVFDSTLAWFSENEPRFPTRSRDHRNIRVLEVSTFGPISSPQSLYNSSNLSSHLESRARKRRCNNVREYCLRGDNYVSTRY